MSATEIIRDAKRYGIIRPGFVGTFAQIVEAVIRVEEERAEVWAEGAWLRAAEAPAWDAGREEAEEAARAWGL